MRQDLDQLMSERGIGAAVVTGAVRNNPSLHYMTKGAHLTRAILVKRQGREPILIHQAMERDEAAKSGLTTVDLSQFDEGGLLQESETRLEATIKLFGRIFQEFGIAGRIGFYGVAEQGSSYTLLKALDDNLIDVTIIGEYENDIFDVARATKDSDEIERMKRVGQATATVVGEMIDLIRDQVVRRSKDDPEIEMLVKHNGAPLTIGDVKRYVRGRLLVHDLEDSEGMILAIGRDAGVPHSRGKEDDPLCLGQSIVLDLFPRETGGGYFSDVTRTFCLGYAPPDVRKAYNDVQKCFDRVMAALEPGTPTRHFEELACDIFEAQGHNTHRIDRTQQAGYVHSLGHGVGLKLHERPAINLSPTNKDELRPGSVVTVEPGLYYPEKGFGIRIEDTVYVDEDGQVHSLTDLSKQLVIEL